MNKKVFLYSLLFVFLNSLSANESFYTKEDKIKEFQDNAKFGYIIANKIKTDYPFPELHEEDYNRLCNEYINKDEELKKYSTKEQEVSLSFCIYNLSK